jgi:urease accessory protein
MTWHATLSLDYTRQGEKTVAHFRHSGPLRILQSLYPEGEGICHNVIVHPPGGLVGGDTLELDFNGGENTHSLVTTPGATRFYRSGGEPAVQRTRLSLAAGARMEWLPLETICYSACVAENHLTMKLEPGSELVGWDITTLGLPGAGLPFDKGNLLQHVEVPGIWLERARIRADDRRLLHGALGLAGQCCFAAMFFVTGSKLDRTRRQLALDVAREVIATHPLEASAGVTSPDPKVIVLRVLAAQSEPAAGLLRQVRQAWRRALWQMDSPAPRIWAM